MSERYRFKSGNPNLSRLDKIKRHFRYLEDALQFGVDEKRISDEALAKRLREESHVAFERSSTLLLTNVPTLQPEIPQSDKPTEFLANLLERNSESPLPLSSGSYMVFKRIVVPWVDPNK